MLNKKYLNVIYFAMIISVLLLVLSILIFKMEAVYYLTWNGIRGGLMPDLFETIWHSRLDNPYAAGAIYPPFCYILLDGFNFFINAPVPMLDRFADIRIISKSTDGFIIAFIYNFIIFILSIFMITKYYNSYLTKKIIFIFFFFASSPFIYMFERGNTVILAMLFLAVFFKWYNSDEFYKVRIALICFAAAICLKIYPILGGLILLTNKKYKLIFESIIYTFLIFFIPFFIYNGLESFKNMIDNIMFLSNETIVDNRGFGYGFKVSIQNTLLAICDRLNIEYNDWINIFIKINFCLLALAAIILKRNAYKILSIMLMMILIPPFSWIYNVVYLYIPFLILCDEDEKCTDKINKFDFFIIFLLFLSFVPLPYRFAMRGLDGVNKISLSTFVCSWSMITMAILLEYKALKSLLDCFIVKIKSK